MNVNDLKIQIEKKELEIANLKRTLEILVREDPVCTLARELHNKFCWFNHTDGCSWHYEVKNGVDQWKEWAHEYWIKKANGILRYCESDNITPERFLEYVKLIRS